MSVLLVVKDKNELQILFLMSSVPTNRPARGRGRRAVEERGNKLAAKDKVKLISSLFLQPATKFNLHCNMRSSPIFLGGEWWNCAAALPQKSNGQDHWKSWSYQVKLKQCFFFIENIQFWFIFSLTLSLFQERDRRKEWGFQSVSIYNAIVHFFPLRTQ